MATTAVTTTGAPTLQTTRLVMRRWRDADRPLFAAMNADPVVMEHFPSVLTRDESDRLVDRIELGLEEHPFGLWAVEVRDTGEFIGFVGLAVPNFAASFTPTVEVGWRLPRDAWGHGYAAEAASEAIRHGFDVVGLEEIVSFTALTNTRSQRVMERLGMRRSEEFDHPNLPPGHRLRRHVLYRLRPSVAA